MSSKKQAADHLNSATLVLILYLGAIVFAETVGVLGGAAAGALCSAIVLVILLSHYVLMEQAPYRRVLPVLALIPLLRLLSFTMPTRHVALIYWFAMVGVPLLIAAFLTARLLGLSRASLGLSKGSWPPQALITLSGLPLSFAAFLLLRPEPLVARLDWQQALIGALVLIIFAGFTEEVIFRGMLQSVVSETVGSAALFYSSLVFAVTYIGSQSWSFVFFMGLVGLFFGWCAKRTDSIWGVVLAHSTLVIGLLLVWPLVWT
jgi:membrane protease YdiL (CAAX protease family)